MPDDDELTHAAEMFRALGSPSRLAIVRALRPGPLAVCQLTQQLGLRQPLVSQHLTVLHAARIVCRARVGREVHYSIADEHIAHMVDDVLTHAGETPEPDHAGEPAD